MLLLDRNDCPEVTHFECIHTRMDRTHRVYRVLLCLIAHEVNEPGFLLYIPTYSVFGSKINVQQNVYYSGAGQYFQNIRNFKKHLGTLCVSQQRSNETASLMWSIKNTGRQQRNLLFITNNEFTFSQVLRHSKINTKCDFKFQKRLVPFVIDSHDRNERNAQFMFFYTAKHTAELMKHKI